MQTERKMPKKTEIELRAELTKLDEYLKVAPAHERTILNMKRENLVKELQKFDSPFGNMFGDLFKK